MSNEIVRLTTCSNTIQADFLVTILKENGIDCFSANEVFSVMMPNFSGMLGAGIQILVNESDLVSARSLLIDLQEKANSSCPNCQSSNIKYGLGSNKYKKIFVALLSVIGSTPFSNVSSVSICKDCGCEF